MTNAYSVAAARGFPYSDCNGGRSIDGVWFGRFTKAADLKGPGILVGWDNVVQNWLVLLESDKPQEPKT